MISSIPEDLAKVSTERMRAVGCLEEPDRVPFLFDMGEPTIFPSRVTWWEYVWDPDTMFNVQTETIKYCLKRGIDIWGLNVFPDFWQAYLETFGCKLKWTSEDTPPWPQPLIRNMNEVDELEVPDIRKDGLGPYILQILKRFKSKVGNNRFLGVKILDAIAPMTTAVLLRGPHFYFDLYRHPEQAAKLLKKCKEAFVDWVRIQADEIGIQLHGIGLCDDAVANLSLELYKKFVHPIYEELAKEFGGIVGVHTCGDLTHLLEPMINLPKMGSIDLGVSALAKVKEIKERYGDDFCIISQLHPTLCDLSPKQIQKEIKEIMQFGAPGGGFYLWTVIPGRHSSIAWKDFYERVDNFLNLIVQSINRYGQYPA